MAWLLIGLVALVIGGAWWIMTRHEQRHFDAQLQNLQRRIARQERVDQQRAERERRSATQNTHCAANEDNARD